MAAAGGHRFAIAPINLSRQCGKTTLVTHYIEGEYFDLERPSDLQVFAGDIEFALSRFQGPVVIDEPQTLPEIFPVIRSMIDRDRNRMASCSSALPH